MLNPSASRRDPVSTALPSKRWPTVWGQQIVKTCSETAKVLQAVRQCWQPPSLFRDPEDKTMPRHNLQTNVLSPKDRQEATGPRGKLPSGVSVEVFRPPWL